MGAKDAVGRYGERVACIRLIDAGWRVLDRNWWGTGGELDIVALDGDVLVAVEVKTRRGTGFGHPAQAVTGLKLARLKHLTGEWLGSHEMRVSSVRIDVMAVLVPRAGRAQIEHLVGVSI